MANYIYIEGEIWKFSDTKYRRYLAANATRFAPASDYGTFVGVCINVTRFDSNDFKAEYDRVK